MIDRINFDELNPTQFENFCFDMLIELGCTDINWRKGTGYNISPSDFGRDIECKYVKRDYLIGEANEEKWFVECKHYKRGVPANELQSILSWCTAERADRCVIVASNFLSNSAKEYIKNYINNNKPSFKISVWEKSKIESLTANMDHLFRKHNIVYKDTILDYINPYHSEYIKKCPYNTLENLINALEMLDESNKNKVIQILSIYYLNKEIKKNKYFFKDKKSVFNKIIKKCIEIAELTSQFVAVSSIVSITLSSFLSVGNPLTVDSKINDLERIIENIEKNKEELIKRVRESIVKEGNVEDYEEFDGEKGIEFLKNAHKESIQNLKPRQEEIYSNYNTFCNTVVKYLIENSMS